jgi:hypothetical protein
MTVSTLEKGYLEADYLEDSYMTGLAEASSGWQVEFRIVDQLKPLASQGLLQIVDKLNQSGMESEWFITDYQDARGMQAEFIINFEEESGQQALFSIIDQAKNNGMQADFVVEEDVNGGYQALLVIESAKSLGMQAQFDIVNFLKNSGQQAELFVLSQKPLAHEVRVDDYPTLICGPGYLEDSYLVGPYLTQTVCLVPGAQTLFTIIDATAFAAQQAELNIVDYPSQYGQQAEFTILDDTSLGQQFDSVTGTAVGQQVLATIYNATNLRILCEFPSRGTNDSNWTATSTATGDFTVQNLDTDIVEQVWRSDTGDITGVSVSTDTGLPQGVFLDTLAILNHNFTRSANVTLIGSNDPTFAIIGTSIVLDVRENNVYYIAPDLPVAGYRYWRIDIDDATNTDNYIEIGTVVFGASNIFQGECFVDEVEFQLQDFTDSVPTEGFTNVANSRSLKRKVRLDFRFLNFQRNNFRIMRNLFETYRTTHKCLFIPTPSATDPEVTARFAGYAKLTTLPTERHNYKGGDADYVSFPIEYDESK